MNIPSQYDVAVPEFTAVYNDSTNLLDLTWTSAVIDRPAPAQDLPAEYYKIGMREGNFPSGVPITGATTQFDEYGLAYVTTVTDALTYNLNITSWTSVSIGIIPFYKIWYNGGKDFTYQEGRIKLLSYARQFTAANPLLKISDIQSTNDILPNLYIRNGYTAGSTLYNQIDKIDFNGGITHITASSSTPSTSTVGPLSYYNIDGNVFTGPNSKIIVTSPNGDITETNINLGSGTTFTDLFNGTDGTLYGMINGHINGIVNIDVNSPTSYVDIPADSDYVLNSWKSEVHPTQLNEATPYGTHVKILQGIDASKFAVGQLISIPQTDSDSLLETPAPRGIVIETSGNELRYVIPITEDIGLKSTKPRVRAYPIYVNIGNVFWQSTTDTNDSQIDAWYSMNVGAAAYKGYIVGSDYYYIRNNPTEKNIVKIDFLSNTITNLGAPAGSNPGDLIVASNGFMYYSAGTLGAPNKLWKKDVTNSNAAVQVATAHTFRNISSIAYGNGFLYLVDYKDSSLTTNVINIYDLTTDAVTELTITATQPVVDKNDNSNDGDVNSPGGNSAGNSGYIADIPPYDSVNPSPVVVKDPENNIIGNVPIPPGLPANPVFTFRKNGDRLYILVNGKVIWTYRLSPLQLALNPFNGYVGWYQYGTRTKKTTPSGSITYPNLNGLYYVFDGTIEERMWSPDVLFTYGKHYQGQALLVFEDNTVIVDRIVNETDIAKAVFIVGGGRKYKIFTNQTAKSPIIPRWIVDLLIHNGLYIYLHEVQP